mgnify:CR=1 FL=1
MGPPRRPLHPPETAFWFQKEPPTIWVHILPNMLTHMRTTIEVSDALLEAARRRAKQRGITLRALFEEGLRSVLASDEDAASTFSLRDASTGGRGLQPEFRDAGWAQIRSATYEGRGE